jgi:ADP-heptose:LPS heptosyltransferase
MALEDLEPLLDVAGVSFEALQVSPLSETEREILHRRGIVTRGEGLKDFGDTAVLLGEIDLLITVDTAAAHLAGAMGLPVWLLLAKACDSRWGDARRFTPWYPSMRLYRQARLGDWSRPLAEMGADLARL